MQRNPRTRVRQLFIALLALLFFAGAASFCVMIFGHVSGQEFAPSHFQSRKFSFYQIPILQWQVTPIKRRSTTGQVSRYVRSNNYITRPNTAPQRWDIVELNGAPGDAQLLVEIMALRHDGVQFWEQWSSDHPGKAAILWPAVQHLASNQLYVLLPEIFEIARRSETREGLQHDLDAFLATAYADLAVDLAAAEKRDLARQAVKEGLADYPDDPRLNRLASQLIE